MAAHLRIFLIPGCLSSHTTWDGHFKTPTETRLGKAATGSSLVQQADCFEGDSAHDCQALGAEFVRGVCGRMPEYVVIPVLEVDDVNRRHAMGKKRRVVVDNRAFSCEEM